MSVNSMEYVTVTLDIPVKHGSGKVTFERTYNVMQTEDVPEPDESKNQGYIIENKFSFSLFPPVKSPTTNHFRALLLDRDISGAFAGNKYDLYFYKIDEKEIDEIPEMTLEDNQCMVRSNTFSKEISENPFELLKIIN